MTNPTVAVVTMCNLNFWGRLFFCVSRWAPGRGGGFYTKLRRYDSPLEAKRCWRLWALEEKPPGYITAAPPAYCPLPPSQLCCVRMAPGTFRHMHFNICTTGTTATYRRFAKHILTYFFWKFYGYIYLFDWIFVADLLSIWRFRSELGGWELWRPRLPRREGHGIKCAY